MPILVHASAVILGESGVLIRGVSGSGKSSLALALIDAWSLRGEFATLVSDDRVACRNLNGRTLLSPHEIVAGLVEWRGLGLLPHPYELKGLLTLIVDLETNAMEAEFARLPEPGDLCCDFNGLKDLSRLRLPARQTYQSVSTIMAFLHKHPTK
jgi:serine kinase of HPr protein (carbohydrate metabolism regulator)